MISDERDDARQAMQALLSSAENLRRTLGSKNPDMVAVAKESTVIIERNVPRLDDALRRMDTALDAMRQDRDRWISENADLGEELARSREVAERIADAIRKRPAMPGSSRDQLRELLLKAARAGIECGYSRGLVELDAPISDAAKNIVDSLLRVP